MRSKSFGRAGFLLALALVLVLAACGSGGGSQPAAQQAEKSAQTPSQAQPATGGTIKFGVITPLTGGAADYGNAYANGIKLAVAEINGTGGVTVGGSKYTLEAVTCDDEFKSDKSVNCGKKLSSENRVPVIMTPATLSAFPLMGFNEQENFIIMATSQTPAFTQKGNKLVVRYINNTDKTMGPWVDLLFKYLKEQNKDVNSVAIMEVNTELGKSWADNFAKSWEARGKKMLGRASYDANGTDFYAQISTLLPKNPDAILLTTVCQPSAIVVKQARELGFKGIFLNSSACSGEELLRLLPPEQSNGMLLEVGAWGVGSPEVDAFIQKYKTQFKADPQFISGVGYEGVRFFAKAVEEAGSASDATKIRAAFGKALNETKNMFNMANLDDKGDMEMPMYITLIKDGKLVGYKG